MADLFFFFFFVHFEWHFFMQANNVILIRPDKIAKPNRTKLHWRNANRIIFSLAVLCNDSHVMSVTSVFSHWQLNARYTPRLFWEQGGTQFILACRQCRILTSSSEIKLHASPVKEREKKRRKKSKAQSCLLTQRNCYKTKWDLFSIATQHKYCKNDLTGRRNNVTRFLKWTHYSFYSNNYALSTRHSSIISHSMYWVHSCIISISYFWSLCQSWCRWLNNLSKTSG